MIQFPFNRSNSFSVIKRSFLLLLVFTRLTSTQAQETRNYRGVVLSSDTTLVLRGIHVLNLGTKTTTVSDDNGYFSIRYRTGDSIEFRHPDWETKLMTSSELNDSVFLKKKNVVLEEVVITANRPNTRLSELQQLEKEQNKKRGIYYNGRPPLSLLSPFGGQPITFFYELFSKNGRRTRRMQKTIQAERDNSEIDRLFNASLIRAVIPIEEKDLELFQQTYRPSFEQVANWSTYDMHVYIKKSYESFKEELEGK